MFTITIGREYGSGGRYIGKLIAEKLGISFYDHELLNKAAENSGLSQAIFENYDEKKDSFIGGNVGLFSYEMSLGQKVYLAQFETIKKINKEENCVIVGRCADYVLKDCDNVVNVFICAPKEERIKRAVEIYGLDPAKAEGIIKKKNKQRRNYYNFYTDNEWGKALNYDICLNSKIGIEACVDLIINYVNERFKKDE